MISGLSPDSIAFLFRPPVLPAKAGAKNSGGGQLREGTNSIRRTTGKLVPARLSPVDEEILALIFADLPADRENFQKLTDALVALPPPLEPA